MITILSQHIIHHVNFSWLNHFQNLFVFVAIFNQNLNNISLSRIISRSFLIHFCRFHLVIIEEFIHLELKRTPRWNNDSPIPVQLLENIFGNVTYMIMRGVNWEFLSGSTHESWFDTWKRKCGTFGACSAIVNEQACSRTWRGQSHYDAYQICHMF